MKVASFVLLVAVVLTTQVYAQDCDFGAAQIICDGDWVCGFEGDYCGGDPQGSVSFCPGSWGQGACIDGGRIVIADEDRFTQQNFEIELQVLFSRLPVPGDYGAGLITKYVNGDPGQSEWGIYLEPDPVGNRWILVGNGTNGISSEPVVVSTDRIYCVRGVWSGDQAELWVNGDRVAAGPINRNPGNTPTPVVIGNADLGQNLFYGMIDEVRFGCVPGCPPAPVEPICPEDFVCHLDGDYCGGDPQGAVSFCPGSWGQGACIDGGWIRIGDDDRFTQQSFEVELRVLFSRLPVPGDYGAGLITKYVNGDPGRSEWGIYLEPEGDQWVWVIVGNGTNGVISDPMVVSTDRIYCVRGVWSGDHAELWVNGERVATGPISRNPGNTETDVVIGNAALGQNLFFGMIDEVRFGCVRGCPPAPVEPVCTDDFVCHLEGDYCGGVPEGQVSFCPGSWGQGACIDGGWIHIGDDDRFTQHSFEVELQVLFSRLPVPGDYGAGLVTKYVNGDPGQSEWGIYLEPDPAGNVWVLVGEGTNSIRSDPTIVSTDRIYCVRGVWSGEQAELWVNGDRVAVGPINRNPGNTPTPVVIGNAALGQNLFFGMIDEVRFGCARGCPPAPVEPVCTDDFVCHLEGDYCGGTEVGGVSFCPGAWGQGACIDGGWIVFGDDDRFTQQSFEVELRVLFSRLPVPGDYGAGLFTKYVNGDPGQSEWGIYLEPDPAGNRWVLVGNGTNGISSEPLAVSTDQIYCVRGVWSGEQAELWVNGDRVAAGPINRNPGNTETEVVIGNAALGQNLFYGMIDEVRFGCISCGPASVALEEAPPSVQRLSVAPNPMRSAAQFTLDGAGSRVLSIFNSQGRLVDRLVSNDGQWTWRPGSSTPAGVYFAKLDGGPLGSAVKFLYVR